MKHLLGAKRCSCVLTLSSSQTLPPEGCLSLSLLALCHPCPEELSAGCGVKSARLRGQHCSCQGRDDPHPQLPAKEKQRGVPGHTAGK